MFSAAQRMLADRVLMQADTGADATRGSARDRAQQHQLGGAAASAGRRSAGATKQSLPAHNACQCVSHEGKLEGIDGESTPIQSLRVVSCTNWVAQQRWLAEEAQVPHNVCWQLKRHA